MKKQLLFLVMLFCIAGMTLQAQQRKVLFEEFTSSTCGPCASMNSWLNPLLEANADKVVVIKYQMNWPGAGDPYYTAEGGTRRTFYSVNAVPDPYTNGVYTGSQSAILNAINNGYAQPSQANITGTILMDGTNITIAGSVTPLISGSGYKIHVVASEKITYDNKRTNGENEFHHVMMKMFPNGNGSDVTLTNGTPIPFNYTYNMATTNAERFDDLEVVVFVQNTSTKAILNAAYLEDITPVPLNMTATQTEMGSFDVNLSWSPPAGITPNGYNIYRGTVKLNSSLLTTTTYQDQAPELGKEYTYAVAAVVDGVEVGYKAKKEVFLDATLPEPTIVSVIQKRGMKMEITWEKPASEYENTKYYLYRGNILQNNGNALTSQTVENTGLAYNKEYCFDIKPVLNLIEGTHSSQVCISLIKVSQPNNLKAEQILTSKEVLLTWAMASSNTEGYNVYRDGVQMNTELVTAKSFIDAVPEYEVEYTYEVYAVASNGGESETGANIEITLIPPPIGIDEAENTMFTIYPNPVSGNLKINAIESITECQIFNTQGQLVFSSKNDIKEIATDGWGAGVYMIRITTEKGTAEKRFLKN